MGIDYSGGMLVGCHGSWFNLDDIPEQFDQNLTEWLVEEHGMDSYSEYFDADQEDRYYGFPVSNVLVSEMDTSWFESIKILSEKFEGITGKKAYLVGSQDIF